MILGSRNLGSLLANISDLSSYAVSLVPKEFRHLEQIINNQKYYVALAIRNSKNLKYEMRKELSEKLLNGVYITGTLDDFTEVRELYDFIDINKLVYNLLKDKENNI